MKLRLLLHEKCLRNCAGCCNKDFDLKALPECTDFRNYDLIMLTGGEPMLKTELIFEAVFNIRRQTKTPIILYTAETYGLPRMLKIVDGVTLTLHEPKDIICFNFFDHHLPASVFETKSMRLNVFKEAGTVTTKNPWKIKDNIEWIENCPLPKDEVFMRYKPNEKRF